VLYMYTNSETELKVPLKALERDNFCCMVTGDVETAYYLNLSNNDQIARYPKPTTTRTNFCHIFSPSTSQGLEPEQLSDPKVRPSGFYALIMMLTFGTVQTHSAGSVMSIVLNYGRIDVLKELNGSDCHRLSNGLTLASLVRDEFDRLCLWFEAIPVSGVERMLTCLISNHAEHPSHLQSLHTIAALQGC